MSQRPTSGDGTTATRSLEPASCETCGTPLEIICPKCDRPAPAGLHRPRPPAGTRDARHYRVRNCANNGCRAQFTPTGPRALYCPGCKSGEGA
jgi:hypothetical protein